MSVSLAELAGFSGEDAESVAARDDVAAYAALVEGLVELRRCRQMTQADVAEAMGTSQSVVSKFERLGGDARFSTIQRYARAVGARLHCLTGIEGGQATAFRARPASGVDDFYDPAAAR